MKVLVVEDNESTRTLLDAVLAARGHEVAAFPDAESALAVYEPDAYSLIVLDWLLPGMDGLQLCRELRGRPGGDRCVILMITARDQADDLRAVLAAGADDYLAKPIDVDALSIRLGVAEGTVRNLLERKRAEAELARAFAVIEKSRDDVLSIVDKFRAGTVLVDPDGRVSFVSRTGRTILGLQGVDVNGRPWEEILPLAGEERQSLRRMADSPEASRSRMRTAIDVPRAERRWVEIDVQDDPRDARGKVFFLYDDSDLHNLRLLLNERAHFRDLVGGSPAMLRLFDQIRRLAEVDSTVLVEGETGTGKELVARAIHYSSQRKDRPFVAMNCAGLTESLLASQLFGHKRGAFTGAVADHKGFFETADTGTIFLDEIGDVPPEVQTSLLRVLQEREVLRLGESMPRKVDVRVIAATHHDLAADAQAGRFRSDLLYRIRVARVDLPPLRERREDVPLLLKSFLQQLGALRAQRVEDVDRDALRMLMAYDWPGNVRELRAVVEYAVVRCDGAIIRPDDLPPEISQPRPVATVAVATPPPMSVLPPRPAPTDDREAILAALREANGNRSVAAERLGMSRSTFYRRLAELGLVSATRR